MNKRLLLLFICSAFIGIGFSQKITSVTSPEQAGFSSQGLRKLDAMLHQWVKDNWIPGAAALIIKDGKIAYYKSVGYNDLTAKTPLQNDVIYRIASQTKAITSVAVMMLYEDGQLLLDDPVSKYIPAFKKQTVLDKFNAADTTYTTVPAKKEVTIRELLTHTSGIGYAQIGSKEANAIYAKHNITAGIGVQHDKLIDAMNRLAKLPLMHQPGERWTYGLNTDLLGCLVEVISGMSLDEFFRTRIFEPLGMKDSHFNLPASKANRLVNIYKEDSTGKFGPVTPMLNNESAGANYPLVPHSYFSGGAGLSSTIYDYAIFLQMLLNNGVYNGKRLLGRNSVRMMTMNQIGDLPFGTDNKFGLGFQVITERGSARTPAQAGTYSWGGAFATSYWVDPKEKLVLLFYRQLQSYTHSEINEKFRALVYQALKN